jgi:hypothetical protein
VWRNAKGDFLSKVDDDCLLPNGWIQTLTKAHSEVEEFGVLGCWRFLEDDFNIELARPKMRTFPNGYSVLLNCWVEGSGYIMKRKCVDREGLLKNNQSFTNYCIRLNAKGWTNGWYYPLIIQEHMDDPRAEHTLLKSDEDLMTYLPLSARRSGVTTLAQWQAQLLRSARIAQDAPYDPGYFIGWRARLRRTMSRVKGVVSDKPVSAG